MPLFDHQYFVSYYLLHLYSIKHKHENTANYNLK
jgi:hypothetical protein